MASTSFDPNTKNLPYFLEDLNQGAEKAFEENAQKMSNYLNLGDQSKLPDWKMSRMTRLVLTSKDICNSTRLKSHTACQ